MGSTRIQGRGIATAVITSPRRMVHRPDGLVIAVIWAFVWGATDGAPSVIQQYRLVSFAPASAPVLFGLNSSAVFLGVSLGGGLGGVAQDWMSVELLGLPAAALALIATAITVVHHKWPKVESAKEAVQTSP